MQNVLPIVGAIAVSVSAGLQAQQAFVYIPGAGSGTGFGTVLAAMPDLDHDGAPELVVGLPDLDAGLLTQDIGAVHVYSGRTGQLLRQYAGTQPGERIGAVVAGAGDVDGDGSADFLTGNQAWNGNQGKVVLFAGATGLPRFTWTGEAGSEFGSAILGVPDFSGDGRADVVIGAPHNSSAYPYGLVRFYAYGGLGHHHQIAGTNDSQLGASLATIGDVTGDGRPEIAIGEPNASAQGAGSGEVEFRDSRYGGSQGVRWRHNATFGQYEHGGARLAAAGDCNGDGVPDVLCSGNGVYVLSGVDGSELLHLTSNDPGFGEAFAGLGDFDGDGHDDIAVGAPAVNLLAGRVTIYRGFDGAVLAQRNGSIGDRFGTQVVGVGDVDGDGRGDVAIGAPGFRHNGVAIGRITIHHHDESTQVVQFGAGCAGSAGVPALTVQGTPRSGASCTITCQNAPAVSVGFWLFGWSNAVFVGTPLPMSLAAHGMPACSLLVSVDATQLFFVQTTAPAFTFANIPSALVGLDLYLQAALLDATAVGGLTTSDAVGLGFGNF